MDRYNELENLILSKFETNGELEAYLLSLPEGKKISHMVYREASFQQYVYGVTDALIRRGMAEEVIADLSSPPRVEESGLELENVTPDQIDYASVFSKMCGGAGYSEEEKAELRRQMSELPEGTTTVMLPTPPLVFSRAKVRKFVFTSRLPGDVEVHPHTPGEYDGVPTLPDHNDLKEFVPVGYTVTLTGRVAKEIIELGESKKP